MEAPDTLHTTLTPASLPPYTLYPPVTLTAAEQQLYKEVCSKVQEKWKLFRAAGAATVTKYQLTIMSMLGPLRRICSGGLLMQEDLTVPGVLGAGAG